MSRKRGRSELQRRCDEAATKRISERADEIVERDRPMTERPERDIVEEARKYADSYGDCHLGDTFRALADEVETLREALDAIMTCSISAEAYDLARAALRGEKPEAE